MTDRVANVEDARSLIGRSRISRMQMAVFGICFFIMGLDGMDVLVVSYAAPRPIVKLISNYAGQVLTVAGTQRPSFRISKITVL